MSYQVIRNSKSHYVECLPEAGLIASEQDALDWMAVCYENDTDRLMIGSANLSDDFFDLSSGLAGAILLKFANYRIRVAAVVPPERLNHGMFQEMMLETNRGNQFRIYSNRDLADDWLTS